MIHADVPGLQEGWTPASRGALLRTTLALAAQPVGARWARTGTLTSATYLDRPAVPYTIVAKTSRIIVNGAGGIFTGAVNLGDEEANFNDASVTPCLTGVQPYIFAAYGPGFLRSIRCRDYLYAPQDRASIGVTATCKIVVRKLDATGGPLAVVLAGETVPFDRSDGDYAVGGYGVDLFEVSAVDGAGATRQEILNVEFEFSPNLV